MTIRAIITLVLLLQLDAASSPNECAVGQFKEDDQLSIDKCLNAIYESCHDTSKNPKNCTQLSGNSTTNGTLSSDQNCTSPADDKERCQTYMTVVKKNHHVYFFLFERYEENKEYYDPLTNFVENFISDSSGIPSNVTDNNFPVTMMKFCPRFQFKAKACQKLLSHCQTDQESSFCSHNLFKSAKDYIMCYQDPKYEHADCDDICNPAETKNLFGIDGINQSRCDALKIRCLNVTSENLLLRCEKRLKLHDTCLVERNETYALCEETIRSMSIPRAVLELTLKDHECFSPLICFEYLKQIMLEMKATDFIYDVCPLEAPFRSHRAVCIMLADFCLNKELQKDITRGNSYCGNFMKFPEEIEETVETTAAFNGWILIFVLGEIVLMVTGAWAGARPYLDNKQLKTGHLKGEQKKKAEILQQKRNHFTERDLCVNFHKLVLLQDVYYFGFLVYDSYCTNERSYSLFLLVVWAFIFPAQFKTAKCINLGLKANWEKSLWTEARKKYATADNVCISITWMVVVLVWRKYNRFDNLWEYRSWPVFVAMAMAFGFSTVKIVIRWLLPLSVDRIILDHKPQIPPKERRRVIHNIRKFLSLPYAEKDKETCRKRRIAQKKLDELLKDEKPKKRVKIPRKKPVSKSKTTTEKTTSLSTFWKKCMGNNTTTVVNEEQAAESKTTPKPKKQKKNGKNKGRKGKTDKPKNPPVLGNKNSPDQKRDSKLAKESPATDPQNVAAKTGNKNQGQPKTQKKKAAKEKLIKKTKHENQQESLPKDKSTAAKTKKEKNQKTLAPVPKALPPKSNGEEKNGKKKK